VAVAEAGRGKPRPYKCMRRMHATGTCGVANLVKIRVAHSGICTPLPLFLCSDLNLKDLRYRLA
jgi:hypothetical protein